jgi:hypothetical protein
MEESRHEDALIAASPRESIAFNNTSGTKFLLSGVDPLPLLIS